MVSESGLADRSGNGMSGFGLAVVVPEFSLRMVVLRVSVFIAGG